MYLCHRTRFFKRAETLFCFCDQDRLLPHVIENTVRKWTVSAFPTFNLGPEPKVIKLLSCSTKLSTRFILLINVKMPTLVGILTFISMINTAYESLKARNFFICRYFSFYEQLKVRAQLSTKLILLINVKCQQLLAF